MATRTAYLAYLYTGDDRGSMLMGAGWTKEAATTDAESTIARDLGEMDAGSYISCEEVEAEQGMTLESICAARR